MNIKSKFVSVITAGLFAAGFSVQSALPCFFASAAEEIQYTFDKKHRLTENVYSSGGLRTNNTSEVQKALCEAVGYACLTEYSRITYADLLNITYLDLSGMGLTDLPECIKYMENLRSLDLSDNLLQSDDKISQMDFSALKDLNYLDLSDNYLTKVPSWYVLDSIITKNIDRNFIGTGNQRSIKAQTPVYYFMSGDKINVNEFKNRILADIRLDDDSVLPNFLYDTQYPSYNAQNAEITEPVREYPLHIEDWGLDSVLKDGYVTITGKYSSVKIIVSLFNSPDNDNTTVEITVYLLDGSDPSTVRARLESLIEETGGLDKDKYTAQSWSNLETASKTSQAIFNYPNADAVMLKTALEQLAVAKNSLILGIDKDTKKVLTDLGTIGKTYKEDDYTPASWKAFKTALDYISEISADQNATFISAQNAIISFQNAQSALAVSQLVVPDAVSKERFEEIYGNTKSLTANGITRNGREYRWRFSGTNIVTPAAFNPQIIDDPKDEEKILLESGKAGNYMAFTTSQTGDFPGKATLSMDVSDKLNDGKYYLYEWTSEGKLTDEVTVKDGNATVTLTKGGTYYISPVIQKFELSSTKVSVDSSKNTITVPPCRGYSVKNFKNLFKYGANTELTDNDGNTVSQTSYVKSGMKITPKNGKTFVITVMGDVDNDGKANSNDALLILKYAVSAIKPQQSTENTDNNGGEGTLGVNGNPEANSTAAAPTQTQTQTSKFGISVTGVNVADVNADGKINSLDALVILKESVK